MNEKNVKAAIIMPEIDNAIRSLFEALICVDESGEKCVVADHNSELDNLFSDLTDMNDVNYQVLREKMIKDIHPEDREEFSRFTDHKWCIEQLSVNVHTSIECRIRHADNRYYWSEIIICNTTIEDSTTGNGCLLMIRDIDTRKVRELNEEAKERALFSRLQDKYDTLFVENMTDQQTGCYNRKGLKYYSDIVIEEAVNNSRNLFVCVSDLNGLKHLNDNYGHAAGDEALLAVANVLTASAPTGSKVVRIGGDEFLIFAAIDSASNEADTFPDKVDNGIEEYNKSHSNPYQVGASYGWVVLPPKDGMSSLDEYIEMADAKMYEMRQIRDKYRRS
jgi:diguanylate cyclase (GGDEF)-like protein